MTKEQWKKRALIWKKRHRKMKIDRNKWRKQSDMWQEEFDECEEELAECEENPAPQPNPTLNKKLTVENGKILYGGSPIELCGVSRWEALWRDGQLPGYDKTWGDYNLDWYENKLIESGINYVRHAGIKNTQFLYDHCKRMKDAGIIVEVTVFRAHKDSRGVLVRLDEMGQLAKLGNVFFDINNEFLDEPENVKRAIDIAKQLKNQGCITSGGAWSGADGKTYSNVFYSQYNILDINSHHRAWQEASFREDVGKGKPVVFNEFFAMKAGLSLATVKSLMNLAFDCGIQGVQYYGFRDEKLGLPGLTKYDPFDYQEILDYAGGLVK